MLGWLCMSLPLSESAMTRKPFLVLVLTLIPMLCSANAKVLRYRIESKGGPTAAYWTLAVTLHVFEPGDVLEYDVYAKSREPGIGNIDITTRQSMRLRDFQPKDQNGVSAGPKSDLSRVAYGKWYHRKIKIPAALIGEQSAEWLVTADGIYSTGEMLEAAFKNIRITNQAHKAVDIYNGSELAVNQIYFATEATLESAILVSCSFNVPIRTTLDWFHSTLPSDKYIGMHAEAYDFDKHKWISSCPNIQPFKTCVFKPWHVAFFRKDDMQNFYGELFTYDLTTLRLHTETMPARWPHEMDTHPEWDARPDRSRVFVQTSDGYQNWATDRSIVYGWDSTYLSRYRTGSIPWKVGIEQKTGENWAIGRAIAPVDGSTDWQFHGTLNSYISDNYNQLSDGTAPLIQINVNDYVTITKIKNFDSVYDGEADGWKADPKFTHFEEAFVINQHMNNNAARERFIFARNGSKYFGLVRWDCSEMRGGKWVLTARTTALKLMTAEKGFSFAGMYDRVKNDKWIQPRELDMAVVNSAKTSLTLQNTGLKTWRAGETALYARLMDSAWKPLPGSEVKLHTLTRDVSTLGQYQVRFAWPSEWKPGAYFIQFEMKDGDTWFSKGGSIPFVKKIVIKENGL